MESAHLTHAHDHARAAAAATRNNSVATAGQEHDLAAAAFHSATNDTHNAEVFTLAAPSPVPLADCCPRPCASSPCSRCTTASSPA